MNIFKYVGGSAALFAVLTAAAIYEMPEIGLISYVPGALIAGTVSILLLAGLSFLREKNLTMHDKNILMKAFIVAVLFPSFFAAGAFIHESQTSWSGGEVHYHADFEFFVNNGNDEIVRLNLVDPQEFCEETEHESSYMCSINDRTGSTEYHEHNDQRIHLEGVFKTKEDASLAAFFETFNGELSNQRLVVPTTEGVKTYEETADMNLTIAVNRGVGGSRDWCLIGEDVAEENLCSTSYGWKASSPAEYVVSPYQSGPNLDDIYIIYDNASNDFILEELREDDNYKGLGLKKGGEGYNG